MTDLALVIRRAQGDDWEKFRDIRLEALYDSPDAFGSTYDVAVTLSARQWRATVERSLYFFAERDGEVIGMVSGGYNDHSPGTHWLYGMYVSPSARGSATASMLVDVVTQWAKGEGATELYLHVTSIAARARSFYKRQGFVTTGERFPMPRDSSLIMLTMRKSLVDA